MLSSDLALPLEASCIEELVALAACVARPPGSRRGWWQVSVEGIVGRLRDAPDRAGAFEVASAAWRPLLRHLIVETKSSSLSDRAKRDLRTLLASLECLSERVADRDNPFPGDELAIVRHRTDLSALTRASCASFASLALRRGIAFHQDVGNVAFVDVDPAKFEMVLLNLLLNAFKHTPRAGVIRCTLQRDEPANTVTLSVADSGLRIATAQGEALFGRAVHHDRSAGRHIGGRVFNLGASRDYSRLHGGTLLLRSTPGRSGCVFDASFPARAPEALTVAQEEARPTGLADVVAQVTAEELQAEEKLGADVVRDERPLVLIVDDSRATQRIITVCLGPTYNIASAFDGVDGLTKAIALKPDLIVTDVMMPRMNGETMIHELRKHDELADVPILVLTATEDRAQVVRLLEAGVEGVVRKPFQDLEVRARVRALVAANHARAILNCALGRHEQNLVQLANDVAQRQSDLEVALQELSIERDAAERANRVKSNFLRMMSHELKTPLAAMLLHLHMLERSKEFAVAPGINSSTPHSPADGLVRMRRASGRLVKLIDTMIEWARVESGRCRLEIQTVDVRGELDAVVAELQSQADDKGVDVDVDLRGMSPLTSDRRLIHLIVHNLLAYALRNTEAGAITVRAEQDGDVLRVLVGDGADPVADDERTEIFSPFQFHTDLADRAGSGSGIGLHVVRDIARAVGGDLVLGPRSTAVGNILVLTLRSITAATTAQPQASTA